LAYFYLGPQREQLFLMPVCMRDWLEEGHLAWFIIDVVSELDTRGLHARHPNDGVGRPAYDPEMMCALLLYSYSNGLRSSRRIEASCRTDAAFRVICGGLVPDHATIARFVCEQQDALEGLFVQGLRLCAAAGLVDLSVLALDGAKMGTDAALAKNRDAAWIRKQVKALIDEIQDREQAEAASPDPLDGLERPEQITTATGRLARLKAALAVIETEEAEAQAEVKVKAQAASREAEQGRKLRGRKPKDPAARLARAHADHAVELARAEARQAKQAAAGAVEDQLADPHADRDVQRTQAALAAAREAVEQHPDKPRQVNLTDPDSRIMKTQQGWLQGYNAQTIVGKNQIVLACQVTQDTNDQELYQPMITTLTDTLSAAGIPDPVKLILADAGYWSEQNATAPGPDRLIATLKDHKQRRAARELGTTTGPPPTTASTLEAMEHRLRTTEGAAAYAQRSQLIEPVFGDRKENRGYRRFRRRGLNAADSEWAFIHLAGNLAKLYHHHRAHNTPGA
jgi:transposase